MMLSLLKKRRLRLNHSPKNHLHYDIHDSHAIQQLEKSQKGKHQFKYDFEFNKTRTKVKLFIAPIAILGGRLGVYAGQNIKKGTKMLGCYAGKRSKKHFNESSLYVFELTDDHDRSLGFIDAGKVRDWTGFINHSTTSNLVVHQRKIKGQLNICFHPSKNIKKGEQLLYDYGKHYFSGSGIKPYYLQPTDNWLTDEEVYLQNKAYYAPGIYLLDKEIRETLELGTSSQTGFLLPAIFLSIYRNDLVSLKRQLKQHLTSLMFACYLGNERIVKTLLDFKADPNRCMLVTGYNAFTTLMLGHANQSTAEKIGSLLLSKISDITEPDKYKLNILHYALKRGSIALVKKILMLFSREQYDWLSLMLKRSRKLPPHVNFDDCLLEGKLDILKLLLQSAIKEFGTKEDSLIQAINKRSCFKKTTFSSTPLSTMIQFEKLLKQPAFRVLQKKTDILKRVMKRTL